TSAVTAEETLLERWLQRLEVLHPKKIDLSLDRVETVLATLGIRTPPYRVLSVAGTNGKGSCVALLERIYDCAGYRVGSYTSPHLWRFNERIRLNGAEATDAQIIEAFAEIDSARGQTSLSYFEFSTVAALLLFLRQNVEIAILEVGLGGRLDAVNAVDADLALLTSIDLDHERWLGSTREQIGAEKAGILRRGKPAVIADNHPPNSVLDHAATLSTELMRVGVEFDYRHRNDGSWDYLGKAVTIDGLPRPPVAGQVQYANAAACLAAVEALQALLPVDDRDLAAAIATMRLPGRLQRAQVGDVEWIFDVAHNPAAAQVLAEELGREPTAGRTVAIVGLMEDKDILGVLGPIAAFADAWLVTCARSERASEPKALAAALEKLGSTNVRDVLDVESACDIAASETGAGDRVVTFGSFQIVGPAMAALEIYLPPSSGEDSAKWTGA
ncbi:MAG: bifunctional tetrahydrofolate synthase/dihydrofolate synthase, partial [Gammaproteobacteria bacterium]|nr:bifunctional tetrahydrofolate synthase/dihydrofolate synthase [Gammaproteobacteria bacterium]